MMFRLALVLLMLFSGQAFAQGLTINNLSSGAGLSGTELIPMFQNSNPAVTTTPFAISGYVTLTPSGGGANSDYAAVNAAFANAATKPVMLVGGGFNVCQELFLGARGVVKMPAWNSGGDIGYGPPISPGPPTTYFYCSGTFTGAAHIGLSGGYAWLDGVNVSQSGSDGNTFTGSISGTTLTGPCNVLIRGQGVNDSFSGGAKLIPYNTIVTTVGTCSSGTETYTLNTSSTVASETMQAATACVEVVNNASVTMVENAFLNGCSGDGYRALADSTKPGFQGPNGGLGRPRIFNALINNMAGSGIHLDTLQNDGSANVVDQVFQNIDIGSNHQDGIFYCTNCGGQPELNRMKIEFNGGHCMNLQGSGNYLVSNIICDNNEALDAHIIAKTSPPYGFFQLSNAYFINRDSTSAVAIDFPVTTSVSLSGILNFNIPSLFQVTSGAVISGSVQATLRGGGWYADATTATAIEPLLLTGTLPPKVLTISGSTFTPDFTGGQRAFEIDLTSACPCTIANPAWTVPDISGVFKFVQDSGGSRTIGTLGTLFYTSTKPTLSTGATQFDLVAFYTDGAGKIAFGSPVLNAH